MRCSTDVVVTENIKVVAEIKDIKLKLEGEEGVKNLQKTSMALAEIRRKYRLTTKEKGIIKWMAEALPPKKTR